MRSGVATGGDPRNEGSLEEDRTCDDRDAKKLSSRNKANFLKFHFFRHACKQFSTSKSASEFYIVLFKAKYRMSLNTLRSAPLFEGHHNEGENSQLI